MKPSLLIFICILTHLGFSQELPFEWAGHIGGTSSEVNIGRGFTLDAAGNMYASGAFSGTVDMDPGPGTLLLTAVGFKDGFIVKLDPAVNLIWAKQISANGDDAFEDIMLDEQGNCYVTGYFLSQTIDIDPGPSTIMLTCAGSKDAFILKLDAQGNFVWVRQLGGPGWDSFGVFTQAANGELRIAGAFEQTVDFDFGPGTYHLTAGGGEDNGFVMGLTADGDYLWASQFRSQQYNASSGIVTDAAGNSYVCGFFMDTCDFDPGLTVYNMGTVSLKANFIVKLDNTGNFVWGKEIPALDAFSFFVYHPTIIMDPFGDLIVTGQFTDTTDLDPGPGVQEAVSVGAQDFFLMKLDTSGNLIWANSFGGTSDEIALCAITDPTGAVYLSGSFASMCDFDPGSGEETMTPVGLNDGFIAKYDASGNFSWAKAITGSGFEMCTRIRMDDTYLYGSGHYSETADFNPGTGVYPLSAAGTIDRFLFKWRARCLQEQPVETVVTCGDYTWPQNNMVYTESGTYTDTILNVGGCDSSFTLDLTINTTTATLDLPDTLCVSDDPLTLDQGIPSGGVYTVNGNMMNTFDPAAGTGLYEVIYTVEEGTACEASDTVVLVVVSCSTAGIAEQEQLSLVLFPNPVSGILRISGTDTDMLTSVDLYDDAGRMIRVELVNDSIDLSHCASGIYQLVLHVNGFQQVYKIAVAR